MLSTVRNSAILLAGLCLFTMTGCDGAPGNSVTTLKAKSLDDLGEQLIGRKDAADIEIFRPRGPFAIAVRNDIEIALSATEKFKADLYLSAPPGKAPLTILLHGLGNSKADHAYQGLHLATWGMHVLTLNLPNQGPWIRNGHLLARIVRLLQARPEILDPRINSNKIILAGHSFGASAVAVALSSNPAVAGGILLDPAGVSRSIPAYLRRIRVPVISLASDERVTLTRNRGYFFQFISGDVATVSIVNASHSDAQYPIDPMPSAGEEDEIPVEEIQRTFVSGLTAAAFSLGLTRKLDFAWDSIGKAVLNKTMFGEMRK